MGEHFAAGQERSKGTARAHEGCGCHQNGKIKTVFTLVPVYEYFVSVLARPSVSINVLLSRGMTTTNISMMKEMRRSFLSLQQGAACVFGSIASMQDSICNVM